MTQQDTMAIPALVATTVLFQGIGSQGINGTISGRMHAKKHVNFAPVSTPYNLFHKLNYLGDE